MLSYIIKTFRGGFSDENDKGIAGSYKHGYGLDIHKRADSLTAKQEMKSILSDSLSDIVTIIGSGYAATTHTGIIQFFVPSSNGTTYCFGATGSIWARSGDGTWTFVYNDENGAIKGAAEWKLSSGVNYLFWATNTSIARKELGGVDIAPDTGTARWTDAVQDYKTTLNPAEWHTMTNAMGQLNIANADSLATIDYDGNFDALILNLRPGNLIKTLTERDDYVVLGSERGSEEEEGHIWSWITTALNYVQKKKIPIKGVNALIYAELPLLQGGDAGEIFYSDFTNVVPLHSIPGEGQVMPSGVSIENDLAMFGFYGGTYPGIWSFGRRMQNRPHTLNYDYRLVQTTAGSTISTIAAVAVIDGTLLVSWGTTDGSTSEYGVDSVTSTTKVNAIYEGLEFSNNASDVTKYFDTVKLIMAPMPANTLVAVKYKMNKATKGGDSSANAGFKYAVTGSGATTFGITDATEAEFKISQEGRIYEVGVELFPSLNDSPEVLDIVTYFNQETKQHG